MMHLEHDHDTEHTHSNDHSHNHDHDNGPESGITPEQELKALMTYLAAHNESHTQELRTLAERLRTVCGDALCAEVLAAAEDYDRGNARLRAALDALQARGKEG